jgi:hypothetical protein
LRPATGKRGAIYRVTLVRLMKHDLISETHRRTLHREPSKYSELCAGRASVARRSFNVGGHSAWSLPAVEGNAPHPPS